MPSIFIFIFVVKLIGRLNPLFKPLLAFIEPVTTKLLVYELGAFKRIWSDERAIVVILVPPDGVKRLISYPCSNERYDLPVPNPSYPTWTSILEPDVVLFLIVIFL